MENNGEIIVTLASDEKHYDYERLSVNFESSDDEIISAINPILEEEEGTSLDSNDCTLKRVDSSQNIYVFPKSTAGRAL